MMSREDFRKKKDFDCVEMKRKAQEFYYEQTKHMTPEEKYAYWKQKEAEFLERRNLKKSA
jgi:hypothetical protein